MDPDNAITILDNSVNGALYTGLALGQNRHRETILYAANSGQNRVEMFDSSFNLVVKPTLSDWTGTRLTGVGWRWSPSGRRGKRVGARRRARRTPLRVELAYLVHLEIS